MKLLFWRKDASSNNSRANPVDRVPNKPDFQSRVKVAKPNKRQRKYLIPLKIYCEKNYTPLAWARVIIRLLPIFRDYNCDFTEMQNPSMATKVEYDLYLLILATMREIYADDVTELL